VESDGCGGIVAAIAWKDRPENHDYPAAEAYLSLLGTSEVVAELIERFKQAPMVKAKAKDLLRSASRLPPLDKSNPHVIADLQKVAEGKHLSPILLVRGDLDSGIALQIADGYHRVCASYITDENTDIPCQIVDLVSHP
jgi:hypothetical protein